MSARAAHEVEHFRVSSVVGFLALFDLSSFVQDENWLAPILAPTVQSNWTSVVQVTLGPQFWSS